jgi:hypothetical protein
MATDLQSVIDYLVGQRGMKAIAVQVTAKDDAPLALAALLTACLDPRIAALDVDFLGRSISTSAPQRSSCQDLPLICNILQYGDIPQWAALLATRRVTLRHVPQFDATRRWLKDISTKLGTAQNLQLIE